MMRIGKRIIGFIATIQSILLLTHLLLYETWTFSSAGRDTAGAFWVKLVLGFLSVSVIVASLLASRYADAALLAFDWGGAGWVGMLSFVCAAAVSSWIIVGAA